MGGMVLDVKGHRGVFMKGAVVLMCEFGLVLEDG